MHSFELKGLIFFALIYAKMNAFLINLGVTSKIPQTSQFQLFHRKLVLLTKYHVRADRYTVRRSHEFRSSSSLSGAITSRDSDYAQWYSDVLAASDMVDHSPVRGCMVIKPWGMGVWDNIRSELDARIKDTDTTNAYFPLLIPKSFLAKEAEHVEGFAKECAVVTHHRLCASPDGKGLIPDPAAELEEPLVIRPTSETVIWNMFSKWINSHRDLPLKINQWANIVRWEMRTRPFLRTSEFLWQEGHTAHATCEEADDFAKQILDMYQEFCEEILAIPVVKGEKSPSERFAGAERTYTIEAMMQNGWALQSGTSHFLGQNFAKAFDVMYQTHNGKRSFVSATSWGVSTRLIGALIMTHSDDQGLVLPPTVAPIQVILVPIRTGKGEKDEKVLVETCKLLSILKSSGLRCTVDDRRDIRHGAKFFEWERKGVPVRIEVGPRDLDNACVVVAKRNDLSKQIVKLDEVTSKIPLILKSVQNEMFQKAISRMQEKVYFIQTYDQMKAMLHEKSTCGFFLAPWKCNKVNEATIKDDCKATIRCYPFLHNQAPPKDGVKCFFSGDPATHIALFARAF